MIRFSSSNASSRASRYSSGISSIVSPELNISPHAFRRTGATLLAHELGIQAAADQLGHTSTSTTKEHYAEPDRRVSPLPAQVLQRLAPDGLNREDKGLGRGSTAPSPDLG